MATLALLAALAGGLQGCFYDASPLEARACNRDTDCDQGQICGGGYCQRGEGTSASCGADAECDDGQFCNGEEACAPSDPNANVRGCVAGRAPDPDDGVDCTRDRCDEAQDLLIHEDTALCQCRAATDCAPEACQRAVCDPQRQCSFEPIEAGTPCQDDGAACTTDERCDGQGACVGTPNDAECDDGLYCNGVEACDPSSPSADEQGCAPGAEQPLDDGIPCTADACDEDTDRATHDPSLCECDEPGATCPGPIGPCAVLVCGERFSCEPQPLAAGSGCDDGAACTTDDRCDEQGACVGVADDAECDDGAFCNGGEVCAPFAPSAGVDGCAAGQAPPLDDGVDCTLDRCDEAQDRVTHTPREACEVCEVDADCVPNGCQQGGRCEEGACVFDPKPEGSACGSGAACDRSACDRQGACVPALDAGVCQGTCRANARCAPEDPNADGDGCVHEPQDGGACELSCGATASGTCEEGACVVRAEGPTGTLGCGDGLDNDCDGQADGGDSDCWVPDSVELVAQGDGAIGLGEGDGATLALVARRGGQPSTSQARNLACVARPLLYAQGFDAGALASDAMLHPTLGANEANLTPGDRLRDGQGYANSTARGLNVCDGYGVRVGPFNTATLVANARSYVVSVTMGNNVAQGLGPGQRLVLAYRTSGGTKVGEEVRYLPLVAVGDDGDRALQTYEFALYLGSNFGMFDLRLEVLSSTNTFPQRACAFVDEVRLESIPRVPLVENESPPITRERLLWDWGGGPEASGQTFQGNVDWTDFFELAPAAGHNLMAGNGSGIVQKGLRWTFGAAQNVAAASLTLPQAELPAALLQDGARDRYRSSPLLLDFALRSAGTTWAADEVTDLTYAEPLSAQPRKLATALPAAGRPAYYASHYEVTLKSHNRYYTVLPRSALPLAGRQLRFERPPFATRTAGVDLDEVNLYSFGRVWDNDARAWVQDQPSRAEHVAVVQSATAGPVRVQCFWQDLDDPATPTRSSAPVVLTFR